MKEETRDSDKVKEHEVPYVTSGNKSITFFHSFEEAEEHQRQMMANMTVEERMNHLEEMRKGFMSQYLLADGTWPPLKRILTIEKTNFK